jgi:hypothetical protein
MLVVPAPAANGRAARAARRPQERGGGGAAVWAGAGLWQRGAPGIWLGWCVRRGFRPFGRCHRWPRLIENSYEAKILVNFVDFLENFKKINKIY